MPPSNSTKIQAIYPSDSLIPAYYKGYLRNGFRITTIEGQHVSSMSGAAFVDAADRLLRSIESGYPLPFEMQKPIPLPPRDGP